MTAFSELAVGVNISVFATSINTQFEAVRSFERGTDAPTIKPTGLLWNDSSSGDLLKRWNGSSWITILDLGGPSLSASGSVAMTGDLDFGGNKGTNLEAGTSDDDAIRKDQALLRDGTQAMTAAINLGGFKGTNAAAGTADTDLVRMDQLSPGRTGVFQYEDDCQVVQASDPDNTWEPVVGLDAAGGSFCPRILILRFPAGVHFFDQSDADDNGALFTAEEFEWRRWTDGPGHDDYVELGQLSVGFQTIRVEVKAKRTGAGTLGFYLRLRRVDNDELQNFAGVQYMAWSGVNQ